ncbi:MAG TPA: DUF4402 domain-containing protein [Allosphingosinicella sp.]|uniref:DUF4402 domain-containing protein n=1 Tax=Allosphingosinicella sp. TaxID=2823234 RepID=UPI002EDA9009
MSKVRSSGLKGWSCCAALLLGTAFAAPAAAAPVASAQAKAQVLQPLTLMNTSPLSFGSFSAGASPGTVIINPDTGTRTVTGGVVEMGGEISAARFAGTTVGNKDVKVTTPRSNITLTRVGGTETMTLSGFTIEGGSNRVAPVNGQFSFRIGGTLAVSAGQPDGAYEGTFEITANYQ